MLFETSTRMDWYRSPIESEMLRELMKRSDLRGWIQTVSHLGLFIATGLTAYAVFLHLSQANWYWLLPGLLAALFVHGTVGSFMGLVPVHELQHRTVFQTQALNKLFEKVFAFISWSDYVWYQQSHPTHHLTTCHKRYDGEVVLPLPLQADTAGFWLAMLAWNPLLTAQKLRTTFAHARGEITGAWYQHVLPRDKPQLRSQHRNWARLLIAGHALLALGFFLSGHWFLIVVFNLGSYYCHWLVFLCGVAQHYGMQPEVDDFRLNTRTFTVRWPVSFLYWNMQYHVEHHMYAAVPFYNLPKLRDALGDDLPVAPDGLKELYREMRDIRDAARLDPDYQFVPRMPTEQST